MTLVDLYPRKADANQLSMSPLAVIDKFDDYGELSFEFIFCSQFRSPWISGGKYRE